MTERSSNLTLIGAIVLVLVGMGVLMELLTRRMDSKLRASPRSLAELQVRQLHYAVEAFKAEVGRYPSAAEGLQALLETPADLKGQWKGPYLQKDSLPLDPWQRAYQYRVGTDGSFSVVSLGEDGRPGGEGEAEDLISTRIVATPQG